jgi:hypothetical protein
MMRRKSGVNIEFGSAYPNTISVEEWETRCRKNAKQRARALANKHRLQHDEFEERMGILKEIRECLLDMRPRQVSMITALRLLAVKHTAVKVPKVIGTVFFVCLLAISLLKSLTSRLPALPSFNFNPLMFFIPNLTFQSL